MPPEWMWPFEDELKIHFEDVERQRDERIGRPSDGEASGPMMSNELAQGMR